MVEPQLAPASRPQVAVFSAKEFDVESLTAANDDRIDFRFVDTALTPLTAVLARGCSAVCAFVNDDVGEATLTELADLGVELVAMRCAGTNNVDLAAAERLGLAVTNVPAYSPYAVAEHCAGLMLSLNRGIHRAHNRVREHNFSLEGLLGFDLHGRTIGIVGTGRIGAAFANICAGFGMEILAFDVSPSPDCEEAGVTYVPLDELIRRSDIISLHCPLNDRTHHLIDASQVDAMTDGVMLINTSRGALIDTDAVIAGLKRGKVGALALDVYEEEAGLFFDDHSTDILKDDTFARLLTFPNVLVTGHQAFFTAEALAEIAHVTIENVLGFSWRQ